MPMPCRRGPLIIDRAMDRPGVPGDAEHTVEALPYFREVTIVALLLAKPQQNWLTHMNTW